MFTKHFIIFWINVRVIIIIEKQSLLLDLNVIMSRSRDWNELQHTWIEWRRRTGQKSRDMFEQLVDVSNQAALLNSTSLILTHFIMYL